MPTVFKAPVARYLEELEKILKQQAGVAPEEALSDAREFLYKTEQALSLAEPGMADDDVYDHFVHTFGSPQEVANSYGDSAKPPLLKLPGYAPGWRICCTKCGRSAPAAQAGITRIAASSRHKYTLGWCRDCQRLRWLRIARDLNQVNLAKKLGADRTPEQVRRSLHRPWVTILGIVALALVILAAAGMGGFMLPYSAAVVADDSIFDDMPDGWTVTRSIVVPRSQLPAMGRKLGGRLEYVSNTFLSDGNRKTKINVVKCKTDQDADRVHQALLQIHPNPRTVQRNGLTLYEFIAQTNEQMEFAMEARYRLGIQPEQVTYRVQFDAAPVRDGDPMAWNRFFNLFLSLEQGDDKANIEQQISQMAKSFKFGDYLKLRTTGLGAEPINWSFDPESQQTDLLGGGEMIGYQFSDLPLKAGVPCVSVEAKVTCESFAKTAPRKRKSMDALLAANAFWPVDDPEIQKLTRAITADATTDREKISAIHRWITSDKNMKYGGGVIGSRWGTRKVLLQRTGHCWDYSDVFVTLSRAAGIPSRQILGWVYGASGHVWAEVLIDNQWVHIDPSSRIECGSDYIPYITNEDGQVPLVYISGVKIEPVE